MPLCSLRYLIVSVFAYAQALDLCCQEQIKTKHEWFTDFYILKSLHSHRTYFHGVYHIYKTFPVKKKKQSKLRKCLEMSFRLIQSQQDRSTWVCCSHRSHFGIRVALRASTNLFLPKFCDNLFNKPYSISASLQEKLSLNGDFPYRLLIIVEKYQTYSYI